jgi:hypothetical protein
MLLWRRDEERGVRLRRQQASELPSDDTMRTALGTLALRMLRGGLTEVTRTRISEWTASERATFGSGLDMERELGPDGALSRSGLLREIGSESIDFVHKLFQEFLAAEEIVQSESIEEAVRNRTDPLWWNVVIFSLAGVSRERRRSVVIDILPSRGAEDPSSVLLAARAIYESKRPDPSLESDIRAKVSELLPPSNRETLDQLLPLADYCLPLLADLDNTDLGASRAFVVPLLLKVGNPQAMALLGLLFADPHSQDETSELLAYWDYFHADDFANALLQDRSLDGPVVCHSVEQFAALKRTHPKVQGRLDLSGMTSVREVRSPTRLVELRVADASKIESLDGLEKFRPLTSLSLGHARRLADALVNLPKGLRRLHLEDLRSSDSIPPLDKLRSLETLVVSGNVHLQIAKSGFPNLGALVLLDGALVSGISKASLPSLRVLVSPEGLPSAELLNDLPNIRTLLLTRHDRSSSSGDVGLPPTVQSVCARVGPDDADLWVDFVAAHPRVSFFIEMASDEQGAYEAMMGEAALSAQPNVTGVDMDRATNAAIQRLVASWPVTTQISDSCFTDAIDMSFGDLPDNIDDVAEADDGLVNADALDDLLDTEY